MDPHEHTRPGHVSAAPTTPQPQPAASTSHPHPPHTRAMSDAGPSLPRPPPTRPHRSSTLAQSPRAPPLHLLTALTPPAWQPDADVVACPVCAIPFNFVNRRHHCRKCGRVVCQRCSQHRITIPREFIVRRPLDDGRYTLADLIAPLSPDLDPDMPANLGGGKSVRVCDPCVPEPNHAPPLPRRAATVSGPRPAHAHSSHGHSHSMHVPHLHRDHTTRPRGDTLPSARNGYLFPSSSWANPQWPYDRHDAPLPPLPRHPNRRIAEDDLCPVCFRELPPHGPDNDDTAREAHIAACIQYVSGSDTHREPPAYTPPHPGTRVTTPPELPVHPATQALPVHLRMARYTAAEKDCVDGEGRVAECPICLEDIETGVDMGRLSCLCTFHVACIRSWWNTKGAGACPLHQVQV